MALQDICAKITSDQLYDCLSDISGGDEQEFILCNRNDIDYSTTTTVVSNTEHKCSHLQLKSGKVGYIFTGVSDKKHIGTTAVLNVNEDSLNDWTHGANFRLYNLKETSLAFLRQLGNGANVVMIIPKKDKGTDGSTKYAIYGLKNGLKISEVNMTSLENKGTTPIALASRGDFEKYPPFVYFDTDEATTDGFYDAKFLQP